jgi:alpha-glucosidase
LRPQRHLRCLADQVLTETVIGSLARRIGMALLCSMFVCAAAVAQGWQHLGKVQRVEKLADGIELTAGSAKVRISSFRDGVIRVRLAPEGTFAKDFSWAIIEAAAPGAVQVDDGKSDVTMTAGNVTVIVNKDPLLISFADAKGNIVLADEPGRPMASDGMRIRTWKKLPLDEDFYGLGDKTGPLDRRGRSFTLWNSDTFGFQESTDPIYKSIPFFIGVQKAGAYGIFFDNTYRGSFDFGVESPDFFSFGAEGGELNYYYIAGPDPKAVLSAYTAMVGRSPLPPYWSLGYQQCRYSYFPEARVREIAGTLRAKKIPADAIYLDIDYQEGYAPFTINRQYFPTFEKMVGDLRDQGFHLIAITDLHIKKNPDHNYFPYDSGMKNDVFVKNPDGSVYVGPVWPGDSVFPDFTLTRVRDWWGSLYKDFVTTGVAGFWNDMNEPAVFRYPQKTMPLDVLHRLDDGTALDHRAAHNIFGMENVRATYEGLLKLRPNERPFVLTRAAYAGAARYAATWTGDNSATWNHIGMSTPMLLSLGLSGYPIVGDDIGGFAGSPPADLLTRWYELGAFNPIYRNHAAKGTADREPWVNGPEHEDIRRRYIELRYQLLPYIYTQIEETARTGIPLMRPVFLDFPDASDFYHDDRDFLFGADLFVAPVVRETLDAHGVALPPGEWYDYWTTEKHTAKDPIALHPRIDEVPLYVRAGAILPMQPVIQNTGERPNGPLELRVYLPSAIPAQNCGGSLYQDDGHTFAYQKGEFLRVTYACQTAPGFATVISTVEQTGYRPWWNSIELTIFGVAASPKEVRLGDRVLKDWRYDAQKHSVTATLPDALLNWRLQVVL